MVWVVQSVVFVCVVTLGACSNGAGGAAGRVERLDDALNRLIPDDAEVERMATGFRFVEGPLWVPGSPGYLLFSDIPANTVYQWSESTGPQVFLQPVTAADAEAGGSGGSNGLALNPAGELVLCEHGNRRISVMDADGRRRTLAERFDGRRLNSPNDIVYHSSGAAFFTDPPYGISGDDSPLKEQPHNGIYRLDADGRVSLLAAGQTRPNGIGLSPDQRTLYVANSDTPPNRVWMSYPVNDDLTLGEGSVFFDANGLAAPGVPDGLALDQGGNLFATGPGGVLVIDPRGRHLGTIVTPEVPANVGFGDDGHSLYITARTSLYRIKLHVRGLVYRSE